MYNLAIRKSTSPPLLAPKLKIYYPAGDRTPDLLNQRQTCYHLSQCGKLVILNILSLIVIQEFVVVEFYDTF